MSLETIIGHHRSLALALRHLSKLGEGWEIASRRNAKGHFSERGHTFVFTKKEEQLYEWLVTFTYEKTGRSFDLVVTARDEAGAFIAAKNFIAHDDRAKKIAEAHYHGWDLSIAKAKKSDHQEGHVEYRQPEE